MARERLSPRLLPKLKLTLTMAPTAMGDTDALTVDTAFLTVAGMVATDSPTADSMAAATTARGKLRLRLRLTPPSARGARTRGDLLTGAATALLTTATTTERRQHLTNGLILINMN